MTQQGEVTRHRLTACNQEQRPRTPVAGTAQEETAIQPRPPGFQAQEPGELKRGGVKRQDKESSLNALCHNITNLKGWRRAEPVSSCDRGHRRSAVLGGRWEVNNHLHVSANKSLTEH